MKDPLALKIDIVLDKVKDETWRELYIARLLRKYGLSYSQGRRYIMEYMTFWPEFKPAARRIEVLLLKTTKMLDDMIAAK
jgi:hypothetical protein